MFQVIRGVFLVAFALLLLIAPAKLCFLLPLSIFRVARAVRSVGPMRFLAGVSRGLRCFREPRGDAGSTISAR